MKKRSILVIDDEPDIRGLMQEILEDEGFDVSVAQNAADARVAVAEHTPDCVLLDIWMPDEDGVSLLKSWGSSGELIFPVIMISGHGTVETAVEATRYGAVDFIEKPVSMAKLLLTVEKALNENLHVGDQGDVKLPQAPRLPQLVGDSEHMSALREQLDLHGGSHQNVMLVGEAGTGRALVAQHLHARSQLGAPIAGQIAGQVTSHGAGAGSHSRFVHLRCDSLSTVNAQRELFGHEDRGAVSVGYLESAHRGSLFLADVELMPSAAQSALLQALEQQGFYRVGGSTRVSCRLRIISASRVELNERVAQGTFDASLARYLSPIKIDVQPLRAHRGDIPALLENYVNWHVEEEGLPYRHFTVAAQNRLRNLEWPGNLLELKNLVQRVLILGGSLEVEVSEVDRLLGASTRSGTDRIDLRHDLPLREARAYFEKRYLLRCLSETQGNIGDLAKHVGMERTHLYRKLRSLDIDLDKVRE